MPESVGRGTWMCRATPPPGESQIAQRTQKNAPNRGIFYGSGGLSGIRTPDRVIKSHLLYQLS